MAPVTGAATQAKFGHCQQGSRTVPAASAGPRERLVGAENPCHQAIFMNHAPDAVASLDPEMIVYRFKIPWHPDLRILETVHAAR
jgi:hypothetical protein